MAVGLTLSVAQSHLDEWVAADSAVATGQSYSIEGRTLTRVDANMITTKISYWDRMVQSLSAKAAGNKNGGVSIARFS